MQSSKFRLQAKYNRNDGAVTCAQFDTCLRVNVQEVLGLVSTLTNFLKF